MASRSSRSASSIVAKAANGFHLLRIDGYSHTKTLLPGQKLSSQVFDVGGHRWRIDYYPNGRDASAAATSNNAISVFLQLDHSQYQGGLLQLQARYKFSLLDHAGNAAYELPAETGSFTAVPQFNMFVPHYYNQNQLHNDAIVMGPSRLGEEPGPGCGHEVFIGAEELERRQNHLIRDDCIVLRCDVAVTQVDASFLAQDEIYLDDDEEEDLGEEGYRAPVGFQFRRPRRRRRPDDGEYVKWCLAQGPGRGRGGPVVNYTARR